MKKCPTCNRTYASDEFTFCLDDGALLSAPYDPRSEQPVSTIRSSGPPPTAVLPHDPNPGPSGQRASEVLPLPPTIASPSPASKPTEAKLSPGSAADFPTPAVKSSRLRYLAIALLALIVGIAGLGLYLIRQSQCPKFKVQCSPYENNAYCYLLSEDHAGIVAPVGGPAISSLHPILALQAAAGPSGITNVKWSVSSGTISHPSAGAANIDTAGYSGKAITVKATFTSDTSFCSNTVSVTFVAR